MSDITNSSQTPPQVPAGFTLIDGPDNLSVLVPTFLVSATQFSLACSNTKNEMEANDGAHGPLPHHNRPYQAIAEGLVHIPADPDFCEREALHLHAEVKALQNLLGISYKDAAHRLYMQEVVKLMTEIDMEGTYSHIRRCIDNTIINDIEPPISKIDSEELK